MDLKNVISGVLNKKLNKKSCSCGCGGCNKSPLKLQLSLNENKVKKTTISEGLNWHLTHQKPLTEHLYRAGSQKYFNLWKEARSLYSRGLLEVNNPNDLELIKETNLGEYGIIYEIEIGDKVKASKEYGGESGEVVDIRGSFIVVKTKEGNQSYHETDLEVLNREGIKVPLDFPLLEENNNPTEQEIIDDILSEYNNLQEINLNKINKKIKSYAKQGLLTSSILLSVANNLHANNPQAAQDILKNNIETVDSESKKAFYNAVIGITQEYISLAIKDANNEIVTYLKELKQYYQTLKSGKEEGNLSAGAKKMEEIILKVLQQIPADQLYNQYGLYNIKDKLEESKKKYFVPKVIKDKNNPNFTYINISYPVNSGYLSALGSKTLSGQEREKDMKKALNIGQKIYDKLKNKKEVEDIEINDLKNGIVQIFIVSDNLNLKNLNESKKENKPLNKPMRDSSGGKAYKVYVRDPKTKNIKTIRFGSGGLRAKIDNPEARKAFAARHKCSEKTDRTKPSYWSCRLPRFAKLLGLKGSFSGFW